MTQAIKILYDENSQLLLDELYKAWKSNKTFALVPSRIPVDQEILRHALKHLPAQFQNDHFLLMTSGSTGTPKLLVGSKVRSEMLSRVLNKVQGNANIKQTIQLLPISYSFCLVNQWLWSYVHEKPLKATSGLKNVEELKERFTQAKDAMICMVGTQATILLEMFAGMQFPEITKIHFAGGRFPQEHVSQIETLFPNAIISNNYGCAEAMPRLTYRKSDGSNDAANVGHALPGIKLRVNEQSEIEFLSDFQIVASCKLPCDWEVINPDTWLKSGDLGKINDDNSLTLIGRGSEIFKRYGEKISLIQVREIFIPLIKNEFCTYRVTDSNGEDGYVLVVEAPLTRKEILQMLSALRKVTRAYWPIQIETCKAIPILSSGKQDIVRLRNEINKEVHWTQGGNIKS